MMALILAFAGVSFVASVIPGPDTAVVIKNSIKHGRRSAIATAAGCSIGQLTWGGLSVLGVGALLARSVVAFTVVKYVGAAYLLYLGLQSLRHAGERADLGAPTIDRRPARQAMVAAVREGLFVNALNPKTALFMSALLPQFLTPASPAWLPWLLASLTACISFTWMTFYAVVFSRLPDLLQRPNVKQAVDRTVGVVLVGLGVRLAAERT